MKQVARSGAVLAAAALSLAVAGSAFVSGTQAADMKVMCQGVNSCKGQSECKAAGHSCKGMNSCKGQGWLHKTKAECMKLGGKVIHG